MPAVRVEEDAFEDLRFAELAAYCGLADADHARGRMLRIWRQCTLEARYILPPAAIDAVLGVGGADALVRARLGTVSDDGIRVHGTEGRVEWLQKARKNARKGGRATKAKWHADRPTASPAKTEAQGMPPREKEKEDLSTPIPDVANVVLPPSGDPDMVRSADRRPIADRAPLRAAGARVPPAPPLSSIPSELELRKYLWPIEQRLTEAREDVARRLGLPKPLHEHPTPRDSLDAIARLRESGQDPWAYFERALAVAIAEAIESRSLDYLGWCIFREASWGMKIRKSSGKAPAPTAAPPKFKPQAPVSGDDRAEAKRVLDEYRKETK